MLHGANLHLMQMGKQYENDNQEGHSLVQYPRPTSATASSSTKDEDLILVKMNIRTKSAFGDGFLKSQRDLVHTKSPLQRHVPAAKAISNGGASNKAMAQTGKDGFATVTVNLISEIENEEHKEIHKDEEIYSEEGTEHDEHRHEARSREDESTRKGEDSESENSDVESGSSYSESSYSEPQNRLALPNITLPCSKCGQIINICRLPSHRDFHNALNTLKFSSDYKPTNLNALIKRRKLLIKRMQESSAQRGERGFVDRNLQKINTAFETLKADIEGTLDTYRILERNLEICITGGRGLELSCTSAVGFCEESNAQWKHMEDAYSFHDNYLVNTPSSFVGLYDGYCGHVTAQNCAKYLHQLIREELKDGSVDSEETEAEFATAFRRAYARFQSLLWISSEDEHSRNRWSGCSAFTGVLTPSRFYLAHAGNVGAALIRGDAVMKVLTSKHDLYNKKERDRVRKSSGVIVKTEKCALVNGALVVTRGLGNLGDSELKNCVINAPKFKGVHLMTNDQIILVATSGLWKVFSFEEIANLVLGFLRQIKEAVRERIVNGTRVPSVTDIGRLENENAEFVAKYNNCGAYFKQFLRPESSKHAQSTMNHFYNFSIYNDLDERDEEPTVRVELDACSSFRRGRKRRLSDSCLHYKQETLDTRDDFSDITSSSDRPSHRRHSQPHCFALDRLHAQLGNNLPLTVKDKEKLLATSLAERLVKSALLAGSLDNVSVCVLLLPGFSLVNIHTLRPDLIAGLDNPVYDDSNW